MLTWWEGGVTPAAAGIGEGVIADPRYRTSSRASRAGNGYPMDIHEFELTPQGDALFTIYSPILVHLDGTPAGKLSPLVDAIVQQVDIKTGLVVWEWHSLRPHPARGLVRDAGEQRLLRRVPHQLDPERSSNAPRAHLRARHLGGL